MFISKLLHLKKNIQNFVKNIFQSIFIIFYGKITKVILPAQSEKISIIKVKKNNLMYRLFKINSGRFYTDTIDDAAVIVDNKIVEGPSYQLRSNESNPISPRNNSSTYKNVVLSKGTPRIKKKIKGSVISLLAGGGANNNYFHWLYDVLPRLGILEDVKEKIEPDYYLIPNNKHSFQKDTLKLLGISQNKLLPSYNYRHFSFDEIYITDHPYNLTNNTSIDHENIPFWISDWLKKKFLIKKDAEDIRVKKIFIDRDDVDPKRNSNRRISNENELRDLLKKEDFDFIKLSELSFLNQINIFYNADIIVGLHGAGFANLSFCKSGTKVVEIRANETRKIIESIAKNNNLNFNALNYNPEKLSDKQNGVINVSLDELEKAIKH